MNVLVKTVGELAAILSGLDPQMPVVIDAFEENDDGDDEIIGPLNLVTQEARCDDEEVLYLGTYISADDVAPAPPRLRLVKSEDA